MANHENQNKLNQHNDIVLDQLSNNNKGRLGLTCDWIFLIISRKGRAPNVTFVTNSSKNHLSIKVHIIKVSLWPFYAHEHRRELREIRNVKSRMSSCWKGSVDYGVFSFQAFQEEILLIFSTEEHFF